MAARSIYSKLKLFVALLLCISVSHGYIQQLVFYEDSEDSGNFLTFLENVPDLSFYELSNVNLICTTGLWIMYGGPNYESYNELMTSDGMTPYCRNVSGIGNLTNYWNRSFRHAGNSDTDVPAATLFSEMYYKGTVMEIDEFPHDQIPMNVGSFALTGLNATYVFFEGLDFDKVYFCWTTGSNNYHNHYGAASGIQKTIGSILKGRCRR